MAAGPRPVPEIALAGAIAFVAGIAGRQYNVSGTGLNQYLMLVAATGTGKEAIQNGISRLVGAVATGPNSVPAIRDFIGPGEIRSDAALLKAFTKSKSFISVFGEVGLLLKRMSGPRASPTDVGIKRVWLDLYNKSGAGNVLNPMIYSDATKNTDAIEAPAFSLLGESTPERFFEALDDTMVADGLLPRFTIIEYRGDRPDLNEGAATARPSEKLTSDVGALVARVNALATVNNVVNVRYAPDAADLFRHYNAHCDAMIRGSNEVRRQIWNRAHLKALKLAAVVAVGIDRESPIIDLWTAQWATNIVTDDAMNILGRFDRGEVGEAAGNEQLQQDKVLRCIYEYYTQPFERFEKYGVTRDMHSSFVFTQTYLSRRLSKLPTFAQDRSGATGALKRAIQVLLEGDEIQELNKMQVAATFAGKKPRAFITPHPNDFLDMCRRKFGGGV